VHKFDGWGLCYLILHSCSHLIVEDNYKKLKNFLSAILARYIELSSIQNKSKNSKIKLLLLPHCYYSAFFIGGVTFSIYPLMTQEICRSFKFVHNCQVRSCPKKMAAIKGVFTLFSADKWGGFFYGWPLRLFLNDSLLLLNLKNLLFFSNSEYFLSGWHRNDPATRVAVPKRPVPSLGYNSISNL